VLLGNALVEAGEREAAISCFCAAIKLRPSVAESYYNLGNVLRQAGRIDRAIHCYRLAIGLRDGFVEAYFNLGNLLREQGNLPEAIACHRSAVTFKPDFAEAFNNLGRELEEAGQRAEAIACYRHAVLLRPNFAAAYNNLGSALRIEGKPDEVLACFRHAIALQPDFAEAYNNLGNLLQDLGRLDESFAAYERAVELAPRVATFHRMLANTGRVAPGSEHFSRMQALAVDMAALPEAAQMELHFALATVYREARQDESSFLHLKAGNQLKRRMTPYDEAKVLALFEATAKNFSRSTLLAARNYGYVSRLPVFVVGMPRSGTTLVEQILASHPQVFGLGESQHFPRLVGSVLRASFATTSANAPWSDLTGCAISEGLRRLGAAYTAPLRAEHPNAQRIIDKLPDNFMRLGLIHLALPAAQIIHVQRDPIDTCLSCFSILFSGHLPFAYDLAELGRYYRGYERLMAHWRAALPEGVMLEVRYEDIVTDFERQARRILEFCGLPWDDRCRVFYNTPRRVQTSSVIQVRKPLYKNSIGQWHRFTKFATPLLEALAA
jgi:tetratricopeptide (TPR) repeat protein